jgi:hypothetical protein
LVREGWVDARIIGYVHSDEDLAEEAWVQLQDVGVDVKFQAIKDLEASIWLEAWRREGNDAPLVVLVMAGLYSFACGLRHAGTWWLMVGWETDDVGRVGKSIKKKCMGRDLVDICKESDGPEIRNEVPGCKPELNKEGSAHLSTPSKVDGLRIHSFSAVSQW